MISKQKGIINLMSTVNQSTQTPLSFGSYCSTRHFGLKILKTILLSIRNSSVQRPQCLFSEPQLIHFMNLTSLVEQMLGLYPCDLKGLHKMNF